MLCISEQRWHFLYIIPINTDKFIVMKLYIPNETETNLALLAAVTDVIRQFTYYMMYEMNKYGMITMV